MRMSNPVFLDHIEAHVENIPEYCKFLVKIFQGGRYKVIADSGVSMFLSNVGINIEVKKKTTTEPPNSSGFCNPCLRMVNAKEFIEKELGFTIERTIHNAEGDCHFFTDHEGIPWHIKDYLMRDTYTNW